MSLPQTLDVFPSAPAPTLAGEERRVAPRRAAGVMALISAPGLSMPLPCVVCDISATGARLSLQESPANTLGSRAIVPAYFTLSIRADRVEVDCAAVWRRMGSIGVRFLAPTRPLQRKR